MKALNELLDEMYGKDMMSRRENDDMGDGMDMEDDDYDFDMDDEGEHECQCPCHKKDDMDDELDMDAMDDMGDEMDMERPREKMDY